MSNCIFCQIVAGESPCYKVYEDDLFLGFLDINPRTIGHSVLISKKHYRWVYDVSEFREYWGAVLKLTQAMQKALFPYFVSYVTHGLEISHAHIHILPRMKEDRGFIPEIKQIAKEKMAEVADKIYKKVQNED